MSEKLLEEIRDELRRLNGNLALIGWTLCGVFILAGIISFFNK